MIGMVDFKPHGAASARERRSLCSIEQH